MILLDVLILPVSQLQNNTAYGDVTN